MMMKIIFLTLSSSSLFCHLKMASMGTAFAEINDGSNPFPEVKSLVNAFLDENVK